jgi:signal transduction histidine kinase
MSTVVEEAPNWRQNANQSQNLSDSSSSSSLVCTRNAIHDSLSDILVLIHDFYSYNSQYEGSLSEFGFDLLKRVHKSSAFALSLIEKLDLFNRIEDGTLSLDMTWVNLVGLLTDVYEMIDSTRDSSNVAFLLDLADFLPTCFYCDPLRLQQVLVNLLNNAFKFTEAGYVRLGAYVEEQNLVIFVDDTGIGIGDDQQGRIFAPFQRGVGHNRRGFGLGLSLCQNFVRLHEGQIHLQSRLGVGSCFSVVLPLH